MAALTPEKFKVIGYTEEDANRIDRPTISYWQDAWRRLRKNPIAMGSLVVLGILLVMVIIGPHIKGYDLSLIHIFVYQRVFNTIKLYAKQRRLVTLVTEQIYEKEKNNQMMISILSHIMEFRNGESGLHVHHINVLTSMLLERLVQKTDRYHLSWSDQLMITTASALHDLSLIHILITSGRLT